jgi:cytidine deaminase
MTLPDLDALLERARSAARASHSPYSRFPVGAALLAAGGRVFAGCNVENASYGLTLCAERVAICTAVAAGARTFRAIAVVGGAERPATPCGACLQVLAEFCGPDLTVYCGTLASSGVPALRLTLGACLPHAFHLGADRPSRPRPPPGKPSHP